MRGELSGWKRSLLTALSFLLPLGIWCFVSYVPWVWHPDVKLEISADRTGVATVYTAGDHLGRDYFPEFAASVRAENAELEGTGKTVSKRANLKVLRHLAPLAVENGWLEEGKEGDDAAILKVWEGVATGALVAEKRALSDENLEVVRANWGVLKDGGVTGEALLKLVPQGRPANPVYLPAPHEVLATGYRDFTREPAADRPSMGERFRQSLGIVFGGFLFACVIGVPLGVLCGTYPFFSRLFEPFIDFFRYLPAPAFSTLLVAIFAANDAPKVALVFVGTVFQMVLVVAKTTRLLDTSLLEAAQTLGAKPGQLLKNVVVPGILPDLYNDLRILLGWAWTWLVIAELIGVKTGLTEVIDTQGRFRNFDSVFPVILLIGVTGFVTDQVLAWFRGILFPYTGEAGPKSRAVAGAAMFVPKWFKEAADERAATMTFTPRHLEQPKKGDS